VTAIFGEENTAFTGRQATGFADEGCDQAK